MTLAANTFDERVIARLLEFSDDSTPWSRRLWQPGTVLIARELLEAGDPAMSASERALSTLQDELIARVMLDPAVSSPTDRSATRKMLTVPVSSLVKPGHSWHVLNAWAATTRAEYLANWAMALGNGMGLPSAECTARLLAAHLFDEGFSRKYVHRWLTYRIKHSGDVHTLASMCLELHSQLVTGPKPLEVLVPLAAHVPMPRPVPAGWLTSDQVRDWRAANVPGWRPIRQHGAVLLTVEALDIYAATDIARDRLTAIRDRFRVGGRREISPAAEMWVAGVTASQPTEAPSRRVQVYAFERQSALWSHSVRPDIEAAMELMAPLERGPAPAATTGAWAAVESLLVGPGDDAKHLAADRLALILAGGHLRAELTSLAWAHAKSACDALASELQRLETNQERAERTLAHLVSGDDLTLARPEDRHALDRVQAALSDPYRYVDLVRRSVEPALRALYRQRNLLSHAGGTAGVAIKPTLERAAPLVAAGMDRIVHVALTGGQSALELAALARVRHEALRGRPAALALKVLEI
ncbi:hypothetical protein [Tessaracoccus flavescens]|uniref:Apea-like HEPN domain-containing protein n=1 Tax=Tessaracoccus flavescens TaxID=399497 RepID=A0A1Q2D2V4_9ACTN|nr:hypothetical protein [Tessaracoccus flavescens]AQP52750.1 hypothetical protein BW733_17805 [Tessaracoccus flavescens]